MLSDRPVRQSKQQYTHKASSRFIRQSTSSSAPVRISHGTPSTGAYMVLLFPVRCEYLSIYPTCSNLLSVHLVSLCVAKPSRSVLYVLLLWPPPPTMYVRRGRGCDFGRCCARHAYQTPPMWCNAPVGNSIDLNKEKSRLTVGLVSASQAFLIFDTTHQFAKLLLCHRAAPISVH